MKKSSYFFTISLLFGYLAFASACKDTAKKISEGSTPPPHLKYSTAVPGTSGLTTPNMPVCTPSTIGFSEVSLAQLVPTQVSNFCVLKADSIMSWGKGTARKIEDVSTHIDGAGEIYSHNYFAKRYDTFKYVDDKGSGTEVEVVLTTYDKPENAYALFTYRAISNADPDPDARIKANRRPLKPIAGDGIAALGAASALLWKGNYLVELTYANSVQSEQQAIAAADVLLPEFTKSLGAKLPGSAHIPADVQALPTVSEGLIPLGIDYVPAKFKKPEGKGEALKLQASGGYATGFMREGDKRYRILAMSREERDAARDAFGTFQKTQGAIPLRDLGDEAIHFTFNVGEANAQIKADGVAARNNNLVLALIDEEFALGDASAKTVYPRLSKEEKIAKLKAMFAKQALGKAILPAASTTLKPTPR